ncbi:MAG: hypothetical protein H7X86_00215 [Gorillibacterium sp.]|nr:hypothetical protein [Gorillibacterium sp.]
MTVPNPTYPTSELISSATFDKFRCHRGDGDMWPITWADDGHLYGGAGDNMNSPMNIWRIMHEPTDIFKGTGWPVVAEMVHPKPVDPKLYCQRADLHPKNGVKPASILCINGVLYLAVELHNYGDRPEFNRQCNIQSWIITSIDYGLTWNLNATMEDFFTGRLASPHFIQFGKDYEGARDEYVYAYFPVGEDERSYWCNADHLLLGRVSKYQMLDRASWAFFAGEKKNSDEAEWVSDDALAVPVFQYPLMTGENHISYNKGIGRYLMGNTSFIDMEGNPRPYHATNGWPDSIMRSQLTLFEAPEPWGPWSLFHQDDNWGTYGDYQPSFPTKWISEDGLTLLMASSGSFDDYNLTLQKVVLQLREQKR